MINKLQVQLVAVIVVLVFAVGILLTGGSPSPSWLRFYSYAVSAALLVLLIWNRWLWRLKAVQKISAVPRDLTGTWRGTLTSQWVAPTTGSPPPPKTAFLVVRQTWSSVSATMLTDEMRSHSSLAKVSPGDGISQLDYMYLSSPDSGVEHRSRMHHGSTSLAVTGNPAARLRGRYWTDRDSRGELDFTQRVAGRADDFESASQLFV